VDHIADIIRLAVTNPELTRRWDYFSGDHPQVYATPKLRETFAALVESMETNLCSVAVDARLDRLRVTGWEGPGADAAEKVWTDSGLPHRQDRMFRWATVYGTSVLLVDVAERIVVPQRATVAAALQDPADPDEVMVAGKYWIDPTTKNQHATVYYPDRTERWIKADRSAVWELDGEPIPQPAGFVPAVIIAPFGDGPVLLDTVASSQDRINKLTSNLLVAAEFGAFKQRVFFTRQQIDPYDIRQAPDHAIVLDPGDSDGASSVHEFSETPLSNYDQAITAEINRFFMLARLPRHLMVNPGTSPSGSAIRADESGLLYSIYSAQREIGEALTRAMRMLGIEANPVWASPEPDSKEADATTIATLVSAGIPWQVAAGRVGWSAAEIDDAEKFAAESAPPVDTSSGTIQA
jgi:hypothetical protein